MSREAAKVFLTAKMEAAIDAGDKPYKANLKALRLLDVRNDADRGEKELDRMVAGLDDWLTEIEGLRNAVQDEAKKAARAVY